MKGSIISSIVAAVIVIIVGVGIFYFGGVDFFRASRCASPLNITNLQDALKKGRAQTDGVRLSKLSSDEKMSFYIAELNPKTSNEAHYHQEGQAYYQILSGQAIVHSGKLDKKENGTSTIKWFADIPVESGDFVEILPNLVNQLENNSDKPLVYLIIAPQDHEKKDRVNTESYNPKNSRCNVKK